MALPKQPDNQRARNDVIYFINELLGMELHEGQKRYLSEAMKAISNPDGQLTRRFILSCANRWGKSAVIACLQLWYLYNKFGINAKTEEDWFNIEYRTANIAPYSSLTEPVFKAIKAIMTSTYPIRDKEGIMGTNKCAIEWFFLEDRTLNTPPFKQFFANNSYIEHLSLRGNKGDSLQGKPYGLITYDEAARSDHLQLEIDDAITGRLLDWTAPLHLLSTPAQDSASLLYYKDLYEEGLVGINASYTQTGSIYENTFFTQAQVAEQERALEGSPLKDQVLHGHFIFGTRTIFPGDDILAAEDDSLNDGIRAQAGHRYIIGVDTAIGSDEMVYAVLDVTNKPYRLVWMYATKGSAKSPQLHLHELCNLADNYRQGNNLQLIVETWNGESARFYQDLPPYLQSITRTYGSWKPPSHTSDNSNPVANRPSLVKKADIIVALKKALAEKALKIPKHNYELVKQLSIYKEDDKKLPTDRLIALALSVWLAEERSRLEVPQFQQIAF